MSSCGRARRSVVLGVDGGGTTTRTIVVDASDPRSVTSAATATVLGEEIFTGASNPNSVGEEKARGIIQTGIQKALASAGCTPDEVVGICLGMSGVDRPEDKVLVRGWVSECLGAMDNVIINNDASVALANATGGILNGVVVISGTGTIAYGWDSATGKSCRAAGWGPLLGDEGSGHDVGSLILRAVTSAEDGRGPSTLLHQAVLTRLELRQATDLIPWAYKSDDSWARIADLAILAVECAEKGDAVARSILEHAAKKLQNTVLTVINKLGLEHTAAIPIVFAGSLIAKDTLVTKLLKEGLLAELPNANIQIPKNSATIGAAMMAIRQYEKKV
ncbi:N-acetyl-D-glucosamine kinase [Pelomyxa schiedti]|nr:N-acetyl-D-glucosamine kinase [Pelomyxa schiedti]